VCLAKLLLHLPKTIEFYLYIQVPNVTSKNVSWLHFSWPTLYCFMYVCTFTLSVLLHIDLFSFSWLQVCSNKFSSVQLSIIQVPTNPLHKTTHHVYNLEFLNTMRDNNVHRFCFPPHTTHCLQPADVSLFKSLKHHWTVQGRKHVRETGGRKPDKNNSLSSLKPHGEKLPAWQLHSGFRESGTFPVNRNAIQPEVFEPSKTSDRPLNSASSTTLNEPPSASRTTGPGKLCSGFSCILYLCLIRWCSQILYLKSVFQDMFLTSRTFLQVFDLDLENQVFDLGLKTCK